MAAPQALPDEPGFCAPERASEDDAMVVVGRIEGPYGVRGWLRVRSYTDPPENLTDYRPWHLDRNADGSWREVRVEQVRAHGEGFRCSIDGVADRDAAAAWRGALVAVKESVLPAPEADEYYWRELIGLSVTTVAGTGLGRVETLMATGANDALVVREEGRERLIPFIAQVAREVDLERGVIVVDWDPDF